MSEKKERKNRFSSRQIDWDKLDNTALLFPVIASREMTNVFRLSANLKEQIVRKELEKAVETVVRQIPHFRMRLREGVFWYYFEENQRPLPPVDEEWQKPCTYIDKHQNNQYMFRVTYYGCRINLEIFHALTDGYGGVIFLKEIVFQYLRNVHPQLKKTEKDSITPGLSLEHEDSYMRNFKGKQKKKESYQSGKALILKGEKQPAGSLAVFHGIMPVSEIKQAAKGFGVTINQLVVAVFVYSVYKEYLQENSSKYPIRCCIPVNLRPFHDSYTLKNFFAMVAAEFLPEDKEYTFEEIMEIVCESIKKQTTKEHLDHILSYNVSNEKNVFVRPVPLFIKRIAMRSVYRSTARGTTATVTNIGQVKIPPVYEQYIENFYAMIAMSQGQPLKAAVSSYQDRLTITFSTVLTDYSILKCFFRTLHSFGIEIAIESNLAGEEEEA